MTSGTQPAARVTGSLRSAGGTGVVRIESRYEAAVPEVWSAITDPAAPCCMARASGR